MRQVTQLSSGQYFRLALPLIYQNIPTLDNLSEDVRALVTKMSEPYNVETRWPGPKGSLGQVLGLPACSSTPDLGKLNIFVPAVVATLGSASEDSPLLWPKDCLLDDGKSFLQVLQREL